MNTEKLYISTIASDAYATARKYGLGIEISDFCTAWNMDDEFMQTDRQLKSNLDGIDRTLLHAPFNELFPCAIDRKARELASNRYKQAISLAKRYGAAKVIIHGGYNPYIYYPKWYVEQSVLFWKEFAKDIPENICIVLENTLEDRCELILDIVRGTDDSRVKMCLDVGHVNAYSKTSVFEWIEKCRDCVSHFHIHNNDGTCDMHNELQNGTIPMDELICFAQEMCPDATYTLELMRAEPSVQQIM